MCGEWREAQVLKGARPCAGREKGLCWVSVCRLHERGEAAFNNAIAVCVSEMRCGASEERVLGLSVGRRGKGLVRSQARERGGRECGAPG